MAIKKFPGLIDVHVHLREPGATHKEDFDTGTQAAVAGGFTCVLDMPNNPIPTVSPARLKDKIKAADAKSHCFIGFHYGTTGSNIETFSKVWGDPRVFGLKIYCNHTTGELLVHDLGVLMQIFEGWKSEKPILMHAEGVELAAALQLVRTYKRRLHVCHVSLASEVSLIKAAKKQGLSVTAGVCPHHLWLTEKDVKKLGAYGIMKPPLATQKDQDALWVGLKDGTLDVVETDHAPHTKEEKASEKPPFGVPGLETAVGLVYKGVKDGKIPETLVKKLLYENPKKTFNIPDQKDTWVELDPDEMWTVKAENMKSKCGWTPFAGWRLPAKIKRVVIEGKEVGGLQ
jgi:carbamoyl-phosphate synthase/aspartate carbamoyltransferase/dihydroorotase